MSSEDRPASRKVAKSHEITASYYGTDPMASHPRCDEEL